MGGETNEVEGWSIICIVCVWPLMYDGANMREFRARNTTYSAHAIIDGNFFLIFQQLQFILLKVY